MKYIRFLLVALLIGSVFTANAQLPESRIPITVENASILSKLAVLEGHTGAVNALAFSPDSAVLASGADDTTVQLWEVASEEIKLTLETQEAPVHSLAFNSDGSLIAAGLDFFHLPGMVWNANTGAVVSSIQMAESQEKTMMYNLAQVSEENPVPLYDVEFQTQNGATLVVLLGESQAVIGWSMSQNSGSFSVSNPDIGPFTIYSAAFSEDLSTSVVGRSDGLAFGAIDSLTPVLMAGESILTVSINLEDSLVAAAGQDPLIHLWKVSSATDASEVGILEGHSDVITSVDFSPDGTVLVSGSHDGTLRLWDVGAQAELAVLSTEEGAQINSVAFSPDGTLIAAAGSDGLVYLWGVGDASEPSDSSEEASPDTVTIQGTVRLSLDGAVAIPGVEISLNDAAQDPNSTAYEVELVMTDSEGNFIFNSVQSGQYVLGAYWEVDTSRLSVGDANFNCEVQGMTFADQWLIVSAQTATGTNVLIASADLGQVTAGANVVVDLNFCQ